MNHEERLSKNFTRFLKAKFMLMRVCLCTNACGAKILTKVGFWSIPVLSTASAADVC